MDPYTINIQGFGSPEEAAAVYQLITEMIETRNVPARVSLNIKRDSENAQMHRYARRMEELNR